MKRNYRLRATGVLLTLILLCLPPLMDCYKPEAVYKEDKMKVMLGAGWFCMTWTLLLGWSTWDDVSRPSEGDPAFYISCYEAQIVFILPILMGCLLASVKDRSAVNIAQIVLTYLIPFPVLALMDDDNQKTVVIQKTFVAESMAESTELVSTNSHPSTIN